MDEATSVEHDLELQHLRALRVYYLPALAVVAVALDVDDAAEAVQQQRDLDSVGQAIDRHLAGRQRRPDVDLLEAAELLVVGIALRSGRALAHRLVVDHVAVGVLAADVARC